MGLRFDRMTCIATPVVLYRTKKSVKRLAERVQQDLVDLEAEGLDG